MGTPIKTTKVIFYFLIIFYLFNFAQAENLKPSEKTKCPVCGMFVYKYKDFLAVIVLKGKEEVWFDGTKDLFKFYLNPNKYKKDFNRNNIEKILVTDYYSLRLIDAKKAYFVIGSDVYGPMGKELIPFDKFEDAKEFMRDHKGTKILKFNEIDDKIIREMN